MTDTTPITPEAARGLWADALVSGEFTQATEALKTGTGHCCLGVACEVYARATGDGNWQVSVGVNGQRLNVFSARTPESWFFDPASHTVLPAAVAEWLGLRTINPDVILTEAEVETYAADHDGEAPRRDTDVATLNDEWGFTFYQIAAIIRDGRIS